MNIPVTQDAIGKAIAPIWTVAQSSYSDNWMDVHAATRGIYYLMLAADWNYSSDELKQFDELMSDIELLLQISLIHSKNFWRTCK